MEDSTSANISLPHLSPSSPLPRAGLEAAAQEGAAAPAISGAPPPTPSVVTRQEEPQLQAEVPQLKAGQRPTGCLSHPDGVVRLLPTGLREADGSPPAGRASSKAMGEDHGKAQLTWTSPPFHPTGALTHGKEQLFKPKQPQQGSHCARRIGAPLHVARCGRTHDANGPHHNALVSNPKSDLGRGKCFPGPARCLPSAHNVQGRVGSGRATIPPPPRPEPRPSPSTGSTTRAGDERPGHHAPGPWGHPAAGQPSPSLSAAEREMKRPLLY